MVELDGGVSLPKNWLKESDRAAKEMKNEKNIPNDNVIPLKQGQE